MERRAARLDSVNLNRLWTILYTRLNEAGSDLMLVENSR